MHISQVMTEYLEELEATCRNYQATLNEGGFTHATKGE